MIIPLIFHIQSIIAFGSICPLLTEDSQLHALGTIHTSSHPPVSDLKIAFVGDQGLGKRSRQVMQMVKDWGAQMMVIPGDFDYQDDPRAFMGQFKEVMGNRFKLLTTIGNHDILKWFDAEDGYLALLKKQAERSGIDRHCSGEYGVKMYCVYDNIVKISNLADCHVWSGYHGGKPSGIH